MRTRIFATAATTVGLALAAPAVAAAATATVTGDTGNPTLLSTASPITIHNTSASAAVNVGQAEAGSFKLTVIDPAGAAVSDGLCWSTPFEGHTFPHYRGNGLYRLVAEEYSDNFCDTALRQLAWTWTNASALAIVPPTRPLLTRAANSFTTNEQHFAFHDAAGDHNFEVKYARGGTIGPDGGISGPAQDAFFDPPTGTFQLSTSRPGNYVMVGRDLANGYSTPWSTPVRFKMVAPFDLESTSFPDSRGPRYRLRGVVREKAASGKVVVSLAKGKHGKRFHKLGRAKIRRSGVFTLRFKIRRVGYYRLRYKFKGSAFVRRGSATELIRIRRHRFFR